MIHLSALPQVVSVIFLPYHSSPRSAVYQPYHSSVVLHQFTNITARFYPVAHFLTLPHCTTVTYLLTLTTGRFSLKLTDLTIVCFSHQLTCRPCHSLTPVPQSPIYRPYHSSFRSLPVLPKFITIISFYHSTPQSPIYRPYHSSFQSFCHSFTLLLPQFLQLNIY